MRASKASSPAGRIRLSAISSFARLDVHRAPPAAAAPRREAHGEAVVVERAADAVDPAEAQGLVEGVPVRQPAVARVRLEQPQRAARSRRGGGPRATTGTRRPRRRRSASGPWPSPPSVPHAEAGLPATALPGRGRGPPGGARKTQGSTASSATRAQASPTPSSSTTRGRGTILCPSRSSSVPRSPPRPRTPRRLARRQPTCSTLRVEGAPGDSGRAPAEGRGRHGRSNVRA